MVVCFWMIVFLWQKKKNRTTKEREDRAALKGRLFESTTPIACARLLTWIRGFQRGKLHPCPTYQLWQFSFPSENLPKTPKWAPEINFLEFPGPRVSVEILQKT